MMRTSATPTFSNRSFGVALPSCGAAGFTLLEILLVVTIIGILASVVVLGATDVGRQRVIRAEAERLALAVELARDESRLRNEVWGFVVDGGTYRFQSYDEALNRWHGVERREFNGDATENGIGFSAGSPFRGRPVDKPLDPAWEPGSGSAEEGRTFGSAPLDGERAPDVVIYPGGGLTPFEIIVFGGAAYAAWVVRSDGIQRTRAFAETDVDEADDDLSQWLLDTGLVR